MHSWRFRITSEGEADLDRLDDKLRRRSIEKLKWLIENFNEVTPLPLGGQWRGFFKLRVGDLRIIYQVDNNIQEMTVHMIDRRDKIYKKTPPK